MDNGSNNGYYLSEVVKLINGNTNITQEYIRNNPGNFPVYSSSINNNGHVGSINSYDFDGEYITITKDGNVGDIFYRKNKFSVSSSIILNVIKNSVLLTKYLYYYLLFNQNKIKQIANSSSTINHLYIRDLKKIKIFLPSISTQQKIIDIIEPHQELYLKFPNCIRIDTYENAKYDMQILIDIIEPIEKVEHTFNKLNNIINNLESFLFNSIYKSSNHITINKLITISNVKVNSNELELRGVGYSGFVNKSNVNRSKLSKQILEDDFVIGLISKNIPIAFNWEKNKIGVSTAYYVFKPINNPMASWYIYYYLKNKNWKQFVKPTSRHGQAFEVNLFLNNIVKFVFDDYLEKRLNFIFSKIKYLKNKYDFLLNKIINVKQKLIKILII